MLLNTQRKKLTALKGKVKRLAKKLGADLRVIRCGINLDITCDAPEGYHFNGQGTHCVVSTTYTEPSEPSWEYECWLGILNDLVNYEPVFLKCSEDNPCCEWDGIKCLYHNVEEHGI